VYFKDRVVPRLRRALAHQGTRTLKVTNTIADATTRISVSDFALWKAYKAEEDGDVKWPGPRTASEGRPGWHIECSGDDQKNISAKPSTSTPRRGSAFFFPSRKRDCAEPVLQWQRPSRRHWYHSEHLARRRHDMSKSKGNYLHTFTDLVEKGYSPMAVRYALLMGHPRKQLNFMLIRCTRRRATRQPEGASRLARVRGAAHDAFRPVIAPSKMISILPRRSERCSR